MSRAGLGTPNGAHRRWFWRIRHRWGERWSAMPDRQVRAELRKVSWRRAL